MFNPHEPYQIPTENPCNGCKRPERCVGCHAECYDHMIYSITQDWEREERKQEREVDKYIGKKKAERTAIRRRLKENYT